MRVTERLPAAYFVASSGPAVPGLVGRDVSRDSLSYAQGAGGIVGSTHDMTRWERALYGGRLLPPRQQAELTALVSTATGQPIPRTSFADPTGFGLGVGQATSRALGTIWYYEGGTFGYRTRHVYVPETGIIIAVALNSQAADDRIGALMESVYTRVHAAAPVP